MDLQYSYVKRKEDCAINQLISSACPSEHILLATPFRIETVIL